MVRLGILISGRGSNMIALAGAVAEGLIPGAEIGVVISDQADAPGLVRAREREIEAIAIERRGRRRVEHEREIIEALRDRSVDLVCLAGYMRLLSPYFINAFRYRILNIHPSLLPAFPGLDAQRQAIEHGVKFSGCTVHFVDETLDGGPIIAQRVVPVLDDDTPDTLAARILVEEHKAYAEAVALVAGGDFKIEVRRVRSVSSKNFKRGIKLMRRQRLSIKSLIFAVAALVLFSAHAAATEHLRFKVSLSNTLSSGPVSGRLLIFMTSQTKPLEMIEPDFLNPRAVFLTGVEIHNLEQGKPVEVDPDALAFPAPFSSAPAGNYQLMAQLDIDHSYTYDGTGAGDLYSEVKAVSDLNPSAPQTIELTLTKLVPERTVSDTESIKLINFESPALTSFWGKPIMMQAGVVLPPSYAKNPARRYPTVYNVHGYGGTHLTAWRRGPELVQQMAAGKMPEMIYVFLNAKCPLGHHVFADSVNNGPWGHALTAELIPYLEKKFRMDARVSGRFLTGHSSGGWTTLWLQVNYPEVFGGTWSTSPDPVDFHKFTGPDLTKTPPQNFYWGADNKPYNLVRYHGREIMTMQDYALLERVEGYYGGQMASFEAVFSPKGADGQPMPIFDRDTGRIDPAVQKYWERYDITRLLKNNWAKLGPKLRGKLHIIVGTADTFHLEEAVYLLRDALKSLNSDARIEFIEGRDHFDLYEGGLSERIAQEMYAVARPQAKRAANSR